MTRALLCLILATAPSLDAAARIKAAGAWTGSRCPIGPPFWFTYYWSCTAVELSEAVGGKIEPSPLAGPRGACCSVWIPAGTDHLDWVVGARLGHGKGAKRTLSGLI